MFNENQSVQGFRLQQINH